MRAEAFAESEEQVAKIREAYMAREKPATAEQIVREKGYISGDVETKVVPAQMAREMQAEGKTIEEIAEALGTSENTVKLLLRPLMAPVPVKEAVPPPAHTPIEWDYSAELASRTPNAPYVIHQDEFHSSADGVNRDDYTRIVYTYYAGDDVLVDMDNHPVPHGDLIVGQDNLKFGHGTDDEDVVFVRNEGRKLEIEICRTQDRYDVMVLGIDPDETD
jgi:hypothetical protein